MPSLVRCVLAMLTCGLMAGCYRPLAERSTLIAAGATGSTTAGGSGSSGTTGVSSSTSGGSGSSSGSGMAGDRTLTVHAWDHQFVDGGFVDETETAAVPLAVLAFDDAGWHSWPPVAVDAGWAFFSRLPRGPVMLELDRSTFVVTHASEIDLGAFAYGRPGQVYSPPTPPTEIQLHVQAVQPWNTSALLGGDDLELFATQVDADLNLLTYFPAAFPDGGYSPQPAKGATQVDTLVEYGGQPLIDASFGDRSYLLNAPAVDVAQFPGGRVTAEIVRGFLDLGAWSASGGGVASVTGTLAPVPQDQLLEVDWRRTAFDALASQVSPLAQVAQRTLTVRASPQPVATGLYYVGPALAYLYDDVHGSNDLATTVSYGDPFPSWSVSSEVYEQYLVTLPAKQGPVQLVAQIVAADVRDGELAAVQAPRVGPAQQLEVDGRSTGAPLSISDLSPVISWSPPSLGSAAVYGVGVYDLSMSGMSVAYLMTDDTSVRIPPGVLSTGGQYAFAVTAWSMPGLQFQAAPFRLSLPYGSADAFTEVVNE